MQTHKYWKKIEEVLLSNNAKMKVEEENALRSHLLFGAKIRIEVDEQ